MENTNSSKNSKNWKSYLKNFVKGVKIPEKLNQAQKEDHIENLRRVRLQIREDYILMTIKDHQNHLVFDRNTLSSKEGKKIRF